MSKSITDVQIVPIAEEHVEGFNECVGIVARERKYLGMTERPFLEASRKWVMSNVEKGLPFYVAVHGDEVLGWCDVGLFDREGFTHRGHLGMGVHPDYRGEGIGSRLLLSTLDRSREIELERVDLNVFASNVGAIHLYEKFGFEVEGRKRRGRKLDGVYDDMIDMVVFFDESGGNARNQPILRHSSVHEL